MARTLKVPVKGEPPVPQIHITDAGETDSHEPQLGHDIQPPSTKIHRGSAHISGVDDFAVTLFFWSLFASATALIAFFVLSWSWITALLAVLVGFVVFRHVTLKWEQPKIGNHWVSRGRSDKPQGGPAVPDTSHLPAVYFLYVLGSGGHTTEMLEIIRQQTRGQVNQHRRYVISSGDRSSQDRVQQLEAQISEAFPDERAGTRDAFLIRRAREVHQSALTAPLTCLVSAGHAINALTREPRARAATRYGYQFKYPHVVVTNGPATGFIVCVVARLLKIFYLVPQNRLKMIYIESWARIKTMSLTGRLFLLTGIADSVGVQHQALARLTGAEYVGPIAAG
ncbi:oligosaccharide biosynthesis protein Alg14 like-domain-containing protein [Lasiosphaeria miniovina]|uniref:UDP-N-acetylglucosamine transferase subunit ALG14 n=1 Tax=Lasiosphaeria miniovina TaxID=1954250 RepID=A0AA40A072_9PEZI|nr:oligosaccharide biosynthesis protein Alg14 like-domain-containing protein [Lasiosphaeria miniovina]KAK0706871.1 oligosaccharide biosynthesis protein Alg14 like-domain-containing protein [Lasiosphaeria miniovina]